MRTTREEINLVVILELYCVDGLISERRISTQTKGVEEIVL